MQECMNLIVLGDVIDKRSNNLIRRSWRNSPQSLHYFLPQQKINKRDRMSQQSQQSQPSAVKCVNCKQFWGSASFQNHCSQCYNKIFGPVNPALAPAPEAKKQEETAAEKYQGEKKGEQEDKGRCFQCRKKVGLLGVQCKCTYVYCNLHRMPENHACTYNYEAEGKDNLKKQIKKIQHEKYQKLDA